MKAWIRGVWGALRGKPVLIARGGVMVSRLPSGDFGACGWMGMTAADAAEVLYQAADAIVEKLPPVSVKVH